MTDPLPSDLAQALASLYRAGKIATAWRPGMLTTDGDRVMDVSGDAVRLAGEDDFRVPSLGDRTGQPDPTDPATLGCLLALVREAHGDPSMYTSCNPREERCDPDEWAVRVPLRFGARAVGWGLTEAHALLAALRAALPKEQP